MDLMKPSHDATLIADIIAFPRPLPSPGQHERDNSEHNSEHMMHSKLKLIEEVNILNDDTAGKPAIVSV